MGLARNHLFISNEIFNKLALKMIILINILWTENNHIKILKQERDLIINLAGVPKKMNDITAVFILLATDLHYINEIIYGKQNHLLYLGRKRQVRKDTKLKVILYRIKEWFISTLFEKRVG